MKSITITTSAFLCYCLVFPETTRTTIAFSFVTTVQKQHRSTTAATTTTTTTIHKASASEDEQQFCSSNEYDYDNENHFDDHNNNNNNNEEELLVQQPSLQLQRHYTRRNAMSSSFAGFAGVITSGVVTPQLKHVFAANANAATTTSATATTVGTVDHPVLIIGGNGRTGMAVAEAIANPSFGNMNAVTLTRSGNDPFRIIKLPDPIKQNLIHYSEPFDVRSTQELISSTIKELSPSVIVYAASASRQGGGSFDVDDVGVEKIATACAEQGAMFILISALAVDRPKSQSYQMTNTLGGKYNGIMDAKYNGEQKTKQILSKSKKSSYTIIRPGVLMQGKSPTGPNGLELNQGDTIGGGISRDELAGLVVGAIQNSSSSSSKNNKKGGGMTVEAYRKVTATKLQPEFNIHSGNELRASIDTSSSSTSSFDLYQTLFANAKID
jgi:hypothetical protein